MHWLIIHIFHSCFLLVVFAFLCNAAFNHSISLRDSLFGVLTAVFSALIMYCLVQFSGDSIETSVYFQKTSIIMDRDACCITLPYFYNITLKTLKDHQSVTRLLTYYKLYDSKVYNYLCIFIVCKFLYEITSFKIKKLLSESSR